jgi:hypothetical protein
MHARTTDRSQLKACPSIVARAASHDHQLLTKAPIMQSSTNELRNYFDGVTDGPGVWKWLHYLDIYHRHMMHFIGREVVIVEVGVYSGGSLPMWRHYFGSRCHVHGVDIQPACKRYETSNTTIHIGDQADRSFWHRFRTNVPSVDIFIDDGGHEAQQQIVTLEEMLPHLRPGGIYACEDLHFQRNTFARYAHGLADQLNAFTPSVNSNGSASMATAFQLLVHSIHFYPFLVVIEKHRASFPGFSAPKHGTQWQPFL